MFDSDGSIGVGVKKRVDIISTYEILKFMSDYLYDKFGVKNSLNSRWNLVFKKYIYPKRNQTCGHGIARGAYWLWQFFHLMAFLKLLLDFLWLFVYNDNRPNWIV